MRDADRWWISEFDPSLSGGGSAYYEIPPGAEGVVTISNRGPESLQAVVVRLGAREQMVSARNGYFIAAWWGISERNVFPPEPEVVRYVLGDGATTDAKRA